MMVLVTYDVCTETAAGERRLRKMAKACLNKGQRVQKSIFEGLVDPAEWAKLRQRLIDEMKQDEDSLRFYFLGANWKGKIEHVGAHVPYDPEGPMVV